MQNLAEFGYKKYPTKSCTHVWSKENMIFKFQGSNNQERCAPTQKQIWHQLQSLNYKTIAILMSILTWW